MKQTPKEIGQEIADSGALIGLEGRTVAREAARAISEARKGAVYLTKAEAKAAITAMGQMTDGNARDFDEWRLQTHGTRAEWQALLRAEAKIKART